MQVSLSLTTQMENVCSFPVFATLEISFISFVFSQLCAAFVSISISEELTNQRKIYDRVLKYSMICVLKGCRKKGSA